MATVSGGIKVNAAITATGTATRTTVGTSTGTIYTAPANGYAIINPAGFSVSSTGGFASTATSSVIINGTYIVYASATAGSSSDKTDRTMTAFYVGPGQSITYNLTNSGISGWSANVSWNLSGVEFVNNS